MKPAARRPAAVRVAPVIVMVGVFIAFGEFSGSCLGGVFLEERQNLFRMAFRLHFFKDVDEALVGTDEIGGALHAFDELAIHVLRLDEVVAVDENHVGIGEEVIGQVVACSLNFF